MGVGVGGVTDSQKEEGKGGGVGGWGAYRKRDMIPRTRKGGRKRKGGREG